MFEAFLAAHRVTSGSLRVMPDRQLSVEELISQFGRSAVNDGLYRIHDQHSADRADDFVVAAFPEYRNRLRCFAFDWLGRQFAFARDGAGGRASKAEVLMFEPGTAEVLEIPVPFSGFHDDELAAYGEEALALSFFDDWSSTQKSPLAFEHCAGYRVPLFLGGVDDVANLEVIDTEVYWTILGQLRNGTLRMNAGTSIGDLTIGK